MEGCNGVDDGFGSVEDAPDGVHGVGLVR